MQVRLGVIMDPIGTIKIHKDSTFAMLLAAQRRGWYLSYMEQSDLSLQQRDPLGWMRPLKVADNPEQWYHLGPARLKSLSSLDIILMRKDPPFDLEYLVTTYILDQAVALGVLVVNSPQSLRDANEKLFALQFPQCCPPTLVTKRTADLRNFYQMHQDIIIKPLDAMGGASVFRLQASDPNLSVIIEVMTQNEKRFVMAQRFIPEISAGDKRILMVNGEPIPYALARIPAHGETRGNLVAGATGKGIPLSSKDFWIAEQVGSTLRNKGILFAGLDVIGDYLTEINVTSPTCIRELDKIFDLDIASQFLTACEHRLTQR
ncbi:glutathione synthetase [Achromatium sp. WMS2]|nr:glutathione synthetase [Achromatium sp. WMS2]